MTSDSKGFEKLYPRVLNYLKVEKKIKMKNMKYLYLLLCTLLGFDTMAQTGQSIEFTQIRQELQKKWPDNRTVNLVFHGHSVPSGYANTPNVKTLQAYPPSSPGSCQRNISICSGQLYHHIHWW